MRQYHSHSVEQDVEWLYAFDVHANAFFCSFLVTYVLQVSSMVHCFTQCLSLLSYSCTTTITRTRLSTFPLPCFP